MNNKLADHFRKPEMMIPLPSQGKFYEHPINLRIDNEIPIKAMRVRDEIEIKSSDLLFNGEALYSLIESCVPDITDARTMPVIDVDPILLGIKYASYGSKQDLNVECPKCAKENAFEFDMNDMISRIKFKDNLDDNVIYHEKKHVKSEITVKPFTLESNIKHRSMTTKQKMLVASLENSELDEETAKQMYTDTIKVCSNTLAEIIANSIISVKIGDEVFDDRDMIFEWVETMDRDLYADIKNKINKLSDDTFDKMVEATCQHCEHEFRTTLEFNPFTFFSESS